MNAPPCSLGYSANPTDLFNHGLAESSASNVTPIVFVVERDVAVRQSLELRIRREGWQPETCPSAKEFLACPRTSVPNCLILDVVLPDINGLELQKHVALERPDTPLIFITEQGNVPTTVQAMKAAAVEFFTKPFLDDVLTGAVREALERSRFALDQQAEMQLLQHFYVSLTPREREVMALGSQAC